MASHDRMMAAALGGWTRLAPFAGVDPSAFEPEELWRRDDPGRVRIVLHMRGGRGQDLVYKQVFAPRDTARWAAGLDGQRRAVRALARDPVHVPPAILAEDAGSQAIIQDLVPGRNLHDQMLLHFDKPGPRAKTLRRAGAFLRAFHTVTSVGEKPFNPAAMLDYVAALGRRAAAGDLPLSDPDLFAVLTDGLSMAARAAAGHPVAVAAQHGDLHARNLIVSEQRTTLIDFAQDKCAPVQYDLARLVVDLGAQFGGDAVSADGRGVPEADLTALAEGYGAPLADDPCLAFLCRCRVLQDWAALPAQAAQRSAFQQERLLRLQRTATLLAAA